MYASDSLNRFHERRNVRQASVTGLEPRKKPKKYNE
jgi:hypothetical protein